eukprot:6851435-Prymnesium_polylepis.1
MLRRVREHRARVHIRKGIMQSAQPPLELRVDELVLLRIALRFIGIDSLHWHEELDAPRGAHSLGAELRGDEMLWPVVGRHTWRVPRIPIAGLVRGWAAVAGDVGCSYSVRSTAPSSGTVGGGSGGGVSSGGSGSSGGGNDGDGSAGGGSDGDGADGAAAGFFGGSRLRVTGSCRYAAGEAPRFFSSFSFLPIVPDGMTEATMRLPMLRASRPMSSGRLRALVTAQPVASSRSSR